MAAWRRHLAEMAHDHSSGSYCNRIHKGLVHEVAYGVRFEEGEGAVFSMPDGKIIPRSPEKRSRGNVFAIMSGNQKNGLKITPDTSIPLAPFVSRENFLQTTT